MAEEKIIEEVKSAKFSYKIIQENMFPVVIKVLHNEDIVSVVTMPEEFIMNHRFLAPVSKKELDEMIKEVRESNVKHGDDSLDDLVQDAVNCIKSCIGQGLFDRIVDRFESCGSKK